MRDAPEAIAYTDPMSRPNHPGFLLVIEGIDGAGKSTVGRRLAEWLRGSGLRCVVSREPTDGPHGRALRQSAKMGRLALDDELDLFLKDRAEHVETLIRPALRRGDVVILDRYYFSTAAYQGARGGDPETIIARNEAFAPAPDLVLLLDVDPRHGTGRIIQRGDAPDEFEALNYLKKVREIFRALAAPSIQRIDAAQAVEVVVAKCSEIVATELRAADFPV